MAATISLNPSVTTNAAGSFVTTANGLVQGTAFPDPAVRYALRGGILASTETLPMWGGIGIFENIPNLAAGNPLSELGPVVGRATTLTQTTTAGLTAFAVFDQDYAMLNTPQSPVPLAASGMMVEYYRLGSGARIAVACDPGLAAALEGGEVGQQVSWDFNNQVLALYDASTPTVSITSITWASTNGGQGVVVAAAATNVEAIGDRINISGATNTGTGGVAAVNGNFIVTAFTDNQHFIIGMPAAAGVIGTIGGTILANQGTGALACRIDLVQIGNSMTVQYDPVTGFATWNRSGTCAVITI